jgi:hypothetical protein
MITLAWWQVGALIVGSSVMSFVLGIGLMGLLAMAKRSDTACERRPDKVLDYVQDRRPRS